MKRKAFTLIELLIVVAIIAILAAIAVPNFLEAQTRSKVSRVRADLRTLDTALKAYYVDYNKFPYDYQYSATAALNTLSDWGIESLYTLSSPIAYITSTGIQDPFMPDNGFGNIPAGWPAPPSGEFPYYNLGYGSDAGDCWGDAVAGVGLTSNPNTPVAGFVLLSYGPDKLYMGAEWVTAGLDAPAFGLAGMGTRIDAIYDPTNGTVSAGDLVRVECPGLNNSF